MHRPPFFDGLLDDISPTTIGGLVVLTMAALLVVRVIRLGLLSAGPATPRQDTTPRPWLPAFSLPRLWRTRKEKLDAQADLVRSETDLLLARLEKARATGGLVEARLELERILSSVAGQRAAPPQPDRAQELTFKEIDQLLASIPQSEMSPELRNTLAALFAARLKEKRGGDQ